MKNIIDKLNNFIEEKKNEFVENKKKKEIAKLFEDAYSIYRDNRDVINKSEYVNIEGGKPFSTINFTDEENDLSSSVYFHKRFSDTQIVFLFHKPEWEIWLEVVADQYYNQELRFNEVTFKKEDGEDGKAYNVLSNSNPINNVPKDIVAEIEQCLKDLVYENLPKEIEELKEKNKEYISDEIKRKFGLDKKEKKGNDDNNNGSDNDSSSSGDADRDAKKTSD